MIVGLIIIILFWVVTLGMMGSNVYPIGYSTESTNKHPYNAEEA